MEVDIGLTLFWIAVILLSAKLSTFVERIGQPPVLGELLIGVFLGNLVLVGVTVFEPIKTNPIIEFLAQFGVVILLFQIGLESNLQDMARVGVRAFLVACVGVIVPFVLGTYLVGPLILPNFSFNTYLFLGATLTATSVGITARVFRDLGALQTAEAQIVLGAAVIDDVLGLIILAVVSAIVTVGSVSIGGIAWIIFKAVAFLVGAIFIGQLIAPILGRLLSRVHTGLGMKFTLAMSFGLTCAFIAERIGLAPIVGAFAAGLVLDAVHFSSFDEPKIVDEIRVQSAYFATPVRQAIHTVLDRHADHHVEELIEPVGHLLAPIFFVLTGMKVRLETLFEPSILLAALIITVIAFVGKVVTGLVAGNVNKAIVGWGMVPRGEVGLIFAATGKSLGIVNDYVFSLLVIVVLLSTLLTPLILTVLIRRHQANMAKEV